MATECIATFDMYGRKFMVLWKSSATYLRADGHMWGDSLGPDLTHEAAAEKAKLRAEMMPINERGQAETSVHSLFQKTMAAKFTYFMTSIYSLRIRWGALLLLVASVASVHAETTRADLLKMPGAGPFTKSVIRQWQPLVTQFGGKVFSDWERGLYEGAIGYSEQSRQWLLKVANKGNAPESQALCLAYKLARGSEAENPDDAVGEKKKADIATTQVQAWYESAIAKKDKKRALSPEEKAAFAAVDALPDGPEGEQLARRRIVICRNLTDAPSPHKLFVAAFDAKQVLPPYALNYLGGVAEEGDRFEEAAKWYGMAVEAGFPSARTNQLRLRERMTSPPPGDRAWESLLVGYRQQAEAGDGSAMIFLADIMERGISGPSNLDIAIQLYKAGIDADRPGDAVNERNGGMGYVFLALYAQERLSEHFQAGRFMPDGDVERKKYLSMSLLLKDSFGGKKKVEKQ